MLAPRPLAFLSLGLGLPNTSIGPLPFHKLFLLTQHVDLRYQRACSHPLTSGPSPRHLGGVCRDLLHTLPSYHRFQRIIHSPCSSCVIIFLKLTFINRAFPKVSFSSDLFYNTAFPIPTNITKPCRLIGYVLYSCIYRWIIPKALISRDFITNAHIRSKSNK